MFVTTSRYLTDHSLHFHVDTCTAGIKTNQITTHTMDFSIVFTQPGNGDATLQDDKTSDISHSC